jgi:uncharacterized protein
LGLILKNGPKPPTPFWQIAQYLSERGFAVLRYDKRGVGANFTTNQKVWGNATVNDLIHDAEKALNVLIRQPEVDPKRISLIGHSEGTIIPEWTEEYQEIVAVESLGLLLVEEK